jgi:hypothetical protein
VAAELLVAPGAAAGEFVTTWHDGRFALWDLADAQWNVSFAGPGAPGDPTAVLVDGDEHDVDIDIGERGITGTIRRQADDAPEPFASMTAANLETTEEHTTVANETGRYALLNLPDADYDLDVRTDPEAEQLVLNTNWGISPVALQPVSPALVPGGTLTGTVTDNTGAPVGDVLVTAAKESDGFGRRAARTEPDGTYEIAGMRVNVGSSTVRAMGDAPVSTVVNAPALVPGGTHSGIDLVVDAGATIVGTVTDAKTGDPVEGAIVADQNAFVGPETNQDGNYGDLYPSGERAIEVFADGYSTKVLDLDLVPGEVRDLDVALTPRTETLPACESRHSCPATRYRTARSPTPTATRRCPGSRRQRLCCRLPVVSADSSSTSPTPNLRRSKYRSTSRHSKASSKTPMATQSRASPSRCSPRTATTSRSQPTTTASTRSRCSTTARSASWPPTIRSDRSESTASTRSWATR